MPLKSKSNGLPKEENELLSLIVETMSDVVAVVDLHGRRVYSSPSYTRLFGDAGSEHGSDPFQHIHPDDRERIRSVFQHTVRTGAPQRAECRWIKDDGTIRCFEWEADPMKDHVGKVTRVLIVSRDVTERRAAEHALHASEARFRSLVETATDWIWEVDRAGVYTFASLKVKDLLGYPPGEILGKTFFDLLAPEDAGAFRQGLSILMQERKPFFELQKRSLHKKNRVVVLETSGVPIYDAAGEFQGYRGIDRDITERKNADKALQESEARYRRLVELSPDGIAIHCQGTVVFANKTAADIIGAADARDLIGRPVIEFVHPDYRKAVGERIRAVAEDGRPLPLLDEKFIRLDGNVIDVEVTAIPFLYDGVPASQVIFRDITERKRVEEALHRSEARLQTIISTLPVILFGVDRDGVFIFSEGKALEALGLTPGEQVGRSAFDLFAGFPDVILSLREALSGKSTRAVQNFGTAMFEVQYSPLNDPQGQLIGVIGVAADVTKHVTTEEALRHSENRYKYLADSLPETVFELDGKGRVTFTNTTGLRTFGFRQEDLAAGLHALSLIIPEDRGRAQQNLKRIISGEKLGTNEYTAVRKDGTTFPIAVHANPIVQNDKTIGLRGIIVDMSDRKRAEEERARLNSAVEQAAESIVITDVTGTILYVNPAFERISGYSEAEVIGENPRIQKSGKHDSAFYRHMWETLRRGEVWSGYITNRRKDGMLYEEEMVISPVRDAGGTVVNYVAVKRDVTREREMEDQLRQSQKMESLGQLASGIAHDFNNVLGVILGSLSLLQKRVSGEDLLKYIDMGQAAAKRGADVAKRLLTFSRAEKTQLVPLSLSDIVEELTGVLQHSIEKTVVLKKDVPQSLPIIQGEHGQLYQMLLNLCINARDAMVDPFTGAGEGTLTLAARTCSGKEVRQRFVDATAEVYIEISIADTGTGMSAAVKQRIFEPFFTTKPIGKGTGLGLSVVYGIVKSHNGFIDVETELKRGTTFHIYLPAIPVSDRVGRPASVEEARGGTERILIVEDEEPLRVLLTDLLRSNGYEVLLASDGLEGIEMYRRHKGTVDLVITDMGLPKHSGAVVFSRIREMDPAARVVIASGYIDPHLKSKLFVSGAKAFLQKPYEPRAMLNVIREILDDRA